MTAAPPSIAQDLGLFAVLVILIGVGVGLAWSSPPPVTGLVPAFHLAFFVHAGVTFYVGTTGSLRTATWLALVVAWVVLEMIAFAGYVLPWAQVTFWLADVPVVGAVLAWLSDAKVWPVLIQAWPALPITLLGLDLVVMHYPVWRGRPFLAFALVAAGVVAVAIALNWVLSGVGSSGTATAPGPAPYAVIPDWYTLPLYALLRAVPDKLAGVVTMLAAMLVPLIWPWARADALRAGPIRWAWRLLCIAFALVWLGLGHLGSMPPDGFVPTATRLAALFYFAFFLVFPFVLGWIARRGVGAAAS